jgi:hypothetical protein
MRHLLVSCTFFWLSTLPVFCQESPTQTATEPIATAKGPDAPVSTAQSSEEGKKEPKPSADQPPTPSKETTETKEPSSTKETTETKETELSGRRRRPVERRPLVGLGSVTNPKLPGQPWRIHDQMRPQPPKITPGGENRDPPSDALVLFDGTDLSLWCHRGSDGELFEPEWIVQDGYMEVTPRTGSLYTLDSFGSCQLHIEWSAPEVVKGNSQSRGNSGIKVMELFEVQVLDSFNNRTYSDGQAGSLYGQYPPLVSAVRPPGEWQSFDIFFEAPLSEEEKLIRPAFVTVIHNGVLVHHHRELAGATGARAPVYPVMAPAAPLMLQDHGNPVRFRNIWIRQL